MPIFIDNYQITTTDYQFVVKKQKGKSQYESISYHDALGSAVEAIFNHQVRASLKKFVIDFNDAATLNARKTDFLDKLNSIKQEILEGLK